MLEHVVGAFTIPTSLQEGTIGTAGGARIGRYAGIIALGTPLAIIGGLIGSMVDGARQAKEISKKISTKKQEKTSEFENHIESIKKYLDRLLMILTSLKDIEKLIGKQEEMDKALDFKEWSLNSVDNLQGSIKEKIEKVREAYGHEDWNNRIKILENQLLPRLVKLDPCFDPKSPNRNLNRIKITTIISLLLNDTIKPIPFHFNQFLSSQDITTFLSGVEKKMDLTIHSC